MMTPNEQWRLAFAEAQYERLHTWASCALEEYRRCGRVTDVTMQALPSAMSLDPETMPKHPDKC